MTTAFSHADINELAICSTCQRVCHADEKACPACTGKHLQQLNEYRPQIIALIDRGMQS